MRFQTVLLFTTLFLQGASFEKENSPTHSDGKNAILGLPTHREETKSPKNVPGASFGEKNSTTNSGGALLDLKTNGASESSKTNSSKHNNASNRSEKRASQSTEPNAKKLKKAGTRSAKASVTTEDPWPGITFPERKIPDENWKDFYILLGICIVGLLLAGALLGFRIRDYVKDYRLEKNMKRSEDTTSHTSGDGVIDRATTQVSATTFKPFRIPAKDIRFQGPLKVRPSFDGDQSHRYNNNTSSNSPPPDNYIFDPNLNEAAEIGSGVEIIEEQNTQSSQMSTVYGASTMKTGYNSAMSKANEHSSIASSIKTSSIMDRFKKKKNQKNSTNVPGLKPVPKDKGGKGGKLRRKLSV